MDPMDGTLHSNLQLRLRTPMIQGIISVNGPRIQLSNLYSHLMILGIQFILINLSRIRNILITRVGIHNKGLTTLHRTDPINRQFTAMSITPPIPTIRLMTAGDLRLLRIIAARGLRLGWDL